MSAATPLVAAVNNGRADCVAELLRAGADQNIGDLRGKSSVHLAVLNDDVACVRLLLDQPPGPVDVADLLGLSIVSGASCDVIETLVKSGRCDVEDGGTRSPSRPLMLAALKGRSDVVDLLLDSSAEVDADLMDEHDRQRLTALQFAVAAAVDAHYKADYYRRCVSICGLIQWPRYHTDCKHTHRGATPAGLWAYAASRKRQTNIKQTDDKRTAGIDDYFCLRA